MTARDLVRSEAAGSAADAPLASRPLYLQARDLMVRRIVEGVWKPGDYLPSESQLAADLRISIGTIRKAMEELVGQGLLDCQHGRGTQVVPHSSDRSRFRFLRFIHADGRPVRPIAHLIEHRVKPATREDRLRLGLPEKADVVVLLRTRSEDGIALIYERIALPADRFKALRLSPGADMLEEIYVLYQTHCGQTVSKATDEVCLATATQPITKAIGCEWGAPLLLVKRVAVSLAGEPIEYRQSWTASLRYACELD